MNSTHNKQTMKYGYDNDICDKEDWRIMYVGNTEEKLYKIPGNDNTYDHEPGCVFYICDYVITNGNRYYIVKPEMVALYLDYSYKLFNEGLSILNENQLSIMQSEVIVFDFIQNISGAILFSIAALECFCNSTVINFKDEDVIMDQHNPKTGDRRTVTKKQFEDRSLDNKVKVFLSLYFKKDIPKKNRDDYRNLKLLRDRLTHMTAKDIIIGETPVSEKNIWRNIFTQTKKNPAIVIKDLLKALYSSNNEPRRLRLCPL